MWSDYTVNITFQQKLLFRQMVPVKQVFTIDNIEYNPYHHVLRDLYFNGHGIHESGLSNSVVARKFSLLFLCKMVTLAATWLISYQQIHLGRFSSMKWWDRLLKQSMQDCFFYRLLYCSVMTTFWIHSDLKITSLLLFYLGIF